MGIVPSPISRIRTFREDVNRLQNKNAPRTTVKVAPPKTVAPVQAPEIKRASPPVVARTAPPVQRTPAPSILPIKSAPPEKRKETPVLRAVLKTAPPQLNEKLAADLSAIGDVKPRSILTQEDRIFDVMETDDYKSEGSIITDRKRQRFKMLPAIVTALKEWFVGQREAISEFTERRQEPVATIRPAKTREEILTKAFKQSAMAPKDDYANLATRLKATSRQRPAEAGAATLTIKKSAEVAAPSWTHIEDEGNLTPTPEPATATAIEEVGPEVTEPSVAVAAAETLPEEIAPVPEAAAEVAVPEPTLVEEPEPAPVIEPDLTPPPYRAPARAATRTTEAPFSVWRVGAVMLLAVLLGTSGTLWFFGGGEEGELVVNKNEIETLISVDEQIAVPLGRDAQSLLRSILGVQPRETSVAAQVYPETNLAGDTIPAGVAEILAVLDTRAPGTFIRAVTAINFGIYRKREPFVVLRLTSFDTALGGMLAWEESMSGDLAPLFGAPVAGTFDPQARTATQIREPYFVDVLVGNYDARLLLDEVQKERLIYAFVNRNTVVITTNRDALLSLAALIK